MSDILKPDDQARCDAERMLVEMGIDHYVRVLQFGSVSFAQDGTAFVEAIITLHPQKVVDTLTAEIVVSPV